MKQRMNLSRNWHKVGQIVYGEQNKWEVETSPFPHSFPAFV